jgi:hypothetical protein
MRKWEKISAMINSFDSWKGTFFCDHQWYVESGNSYEAFDPELVELVVGRYWLFFRLTLHERALDYCTLYGSHLDLGLDPLPFLLQW